MLESSNYLARIYAYIYHTGAKSQVKINIQSRKITPLTTDERKETPVGCNHPILNYLEVHHVNHNHPLHSIS